MCSFWLSGSIVPNLIIYRPVPSPSRFETRQYAEKLNTLKRIIDTVNSFHEQNKNISSSLFLRRLKTHENNSRGSFNLNTRACLWILSAVVYVHPSPLAVVSSPETFQSCKAAPKAKIFKVYTPETSCMKGTSIHINPLINNRSNFRGEWIIVEKIIATFREERALAEKTRGESSSKVNSHSKNRAN